MNRVIITGASGFLGKNLVAHLLKKQIEIIAVVRDKAKLKDNTNPKLQIIELDLQDIGRLPEIITQNDYHSFYHFGWAGTSGADRENYELQAGNIKASCDAVKAAKILGCKKFINAGSLMEFESRKFMELPGQKPAGNYIYRSAKLAAHYMAKAEAGRRNLPFINLIISNVYGKGEVSDRFISTTLRKILSNDKMTFTSGTQLYDFINIEDAVEAFYAVGERGKDYTDYYIGSNEVKQLKKYIEDIFDSLPVKITPVFGEIPYDGVSLTYEEFDRQRLKLDTGFACKIPFKEGILNNYKWLLEQKAGC